MFSTATPTWSIADSIRRGGYRAEPGLLGRRRCLWRRGRGQAEVDSGAAVRARGGNPQQHALDVLALQGLPREQPVGQLVQLGLVPLQHIHRRPVRLVSEVADLDVVPVSYTH